VSDIGSRAAALLGMGLMLLLAWGLSSDRSRIPWRTVGFGLGLQLALGVLLLKTPVGSVFFDLMQAVTTALGAYTDEGARFVFGAALADVGFSFVIHVLPLILVMGSLFSILYHVGVLQRVVAVLGRALSRLMGISGAESLCAVANLFVGMTESALVVRPYLERMTRSELFLLMTLGMATVAGSVMVAYVRMLDGDVYAGHLATATLLSAPAGILIAKLMVPEVDSPETADPEAARISLDSVNVVDAAATGALAGLRMAAYVGAMLIAFVALVALCNDVLGQLGALVGLPGLTLQQILGTLLAPLAWLMGVPWGEASQVGALLGMKTVLNEFIAYQELSQLIEAGALSARAAAIASYALCGFANLGSLAILLGGLSGLAPGRRGEVAQMGLLSLLSGSLATFMTACVASLLL
jgi:CNT family concentrative nucleoside transporter